MGWLLVRESGENRGWNKGCNSIPRAAVRGYIYGHALHTDAQGNKGYRSRTAQPIGAGDCWRGAAGQGGRIVLGGTDGAAGRGRRGGDCGFPRRASRRGGDGRASAGEREGRGQGIEAGCGCNDYTYEEVEGMVTVFGIGIR